MINRVFPNITKLTLMLPKRCNLACDYCVMIGNQERETDDATITTVSDSIEKVLRLFPSIKGFQLWCGEPLCNIGLLRKLRLLLDDYGLEMWLTATNGVLLNDDEIFSFWQNYIETAKSFTTFSEPINRISLDCRKSSRYKSDLALYEKAVNGVQMCWKNNIEVFLKSVYTHETFHDQLLSSMEDFPRIYSDALRFGCNESLLMRSFNVLKVGKKTFLSLSVDLDTTCRWGDLDILTSGYVSGYKKLTKTYGSYLEEDIVFLPPFVAKTIFSRYQRYPLNCCICSSFSDHIFWDVSSGDLYPCHAGGDLFGEDIGSFLNIITDYFDEQVFDRLGIYFSQRSKSCYDCSYATSCFGPCNRRLASEQDTPESYWDIRKIPKCYIAKAINPYVKELAQITLDNCF